MAILSKCKFQGHLIIGDPIYIIKDIVDISTRPKLEQYVPVECTPEMLRNDDISLLYNYGMEDYYYELDQWEKKAQSDWDICEYGHNLERLGFKHFITSEMGYSFGSYAVHELNTGAFLGQFCSDSGIIGVFELDEILAYDEAFDKFNTMPWAICFIPNYSGTVAFTKHNDESGIEADIRITGFGNLKFQSRQVGF